MSYTKFAIHTAISVALWVIILGGLGYLFGECIIIILKNATSYGKYILLALVSMALIHWLVFKRKSDKYCLDCKDGELEVAS